MNLEKAERISEWRKNGASWRRVSERYCDEFVKEGHEEKLLSGNQIHGRDLCNRAARFLGTERADYWQ